MTNTVVEDARLASVETASLFQKQWHVYRTVVDNNELCHQNIIEAIQCDLKSLKKEGACFVADVGCGDAHVPSTVFAGMDGLRMKHFTGVDASRDALNIAKRSSIGADEVTLVESELVEFLSRPQDGDASRFDIAFATFILHHFPLEEKKKLVKQIYERLSPGGLFYYGDVYNRFPGTDSRDVVQKHWHQRMHAYRGLNEEEIRDVWKHVSENDIPETLDDLRDVMAQAGFEHVEVLFDDDFYVCLVRGVKPAA